MTKQLTLINGSHKGGAHGWRLDQQTREIGRRGLVDARAALVQARRRGQAAGRPGGPGPARRGGAAGARDRPAA